MILQSSSAPLVLMSSCCSSLRAYHFLIEALITSFIKTSSMSRSNREAKYNQMMRIEDDLEGQSSYNGWDEFYSTKR